MKTIQLPQNVASLQNAFKTVIEQYQGSPVKNQNKLNECTAIALGFKNYDHFSGVLKTENTEPLSVFIAVNGDVDIDDTDIDAIIFEDELVDYRLVDRNDEIENLIMWIYESSNDQQRKHSVDLMKEDLKQLLNLDDEYLFSAINTNEYVSSSEDIESFNSICYEILEAQKTLELENK